MQNSFLKITCNFYFSCTLVFTSFIGFYMTATEIARCIARFLPYTVGGYENGYL